MRQLTVRTFVVIKLIKSSPQENRCETHTKKALIPKDTQKEKKKHSPEVRKQEKIRRTWGLGEDRAVPGAEAEATRQPRGWSRCFAHQSYWHVPSDQPALQKALGSRLLSPPPGLPSLSLSLSLTIFSTQFLQQTFSESAT